MFLLFKDNIIYTDIELLPGTIYITMHSFMYKLENK